MTYTAQDVDARGNDLLLVAIANRVYVLDWTAYRDQWNWEAFGPIYRKITIGPVPGNREEQEGGTFSLKSLKRFRQLDYELATPPADDPVQSQWKVTVQDTTSGATGATGYRRLQQQSNVKIAQQGYSFLITLEHDANEDFPLLWWQAEWEEMGDRRRADDIVNV